MSENAPETEGQSPLDEARVDVEEYGDGLISQDQPDYSQEDHLAEQTDNSGEPGQDAPQGATDVQDDDEDDEDDSESTGSQTPAN